ncbi:amino acid permease-associated region [Burkholderia sp. TJI49]|nr:amino acid permease-associated region [Burkholderia sp. TJI49]
MLTLLGAGLMIAVMATTYFTPEFHMTLIFGIPFLAALSVVYAVWYRRAQPALQPEAK